MKSALKHEADLGKFVLSIKSPLGMSCVFCLNGAGARTLSEECRITCKG